MQLSLRASAHQVTKEPSLAESITTHISTLLPQGPGNRVNHTLVLKLPDKGSHIPSLTQRLSATPSYDVPKVRRIATLEYASWHKVALKVCLSRRSLCATIYILLIMYTIVTYKTKAFLWHDPFFSPISY